MEQFRYRVIASMFAILVAFLVATAIGCATGGAPASGAWKDGSYRTEARGFKGQVILETKIVKGRIASIEVIDHADTEALAGPVFVKFIESVLKSQSPDVDAIGGATYSEKAIREALAKALAEAAKN